MNEAYLSPAKNQKVKFSAGTYFLSSMGPKALRRPNLHSMDSSSQNRQTSPFTSSNIHWKNPKSTQYVNLCDKGEPI